MPTMGTKKGNKGKKGQPHDQAAERKVVYPEYGSEICIGEGAITVAQAKTLMGWEEIPKEAGSEVKPFLTDLFGNKIRCTNNDRNRPFYYDRSLMYAQDILNKKWAPDGPNGEALIIGRTELVLSGQHRLIALIFAGQIWDGAKFNGGDQSVHWKEIWEHEPTMETWVSTGVHETKDTLRTLDNVLTRTEADVMFTEDFFRDYTSSERQTLTKMVSNAVKMLWERTAAKKDAFSPRRSIAETMRFLDNHPRVLNAVEHIYSVNKKQGLNRVMSPGYASALLYLMAASETDPNDYYGADVKTEDQLTLDAALELESGTTTTWEHACEFWKLLSEESKAFDPLFKYRIPLEGEKKNEPHASFCFAVGQHSGSPVEKIAVIANAWKVFAQGKRLTEANIRTKYDLDYNDDDTLSTATLTGTYPIGGIDLMNPRASKDDDPIEEATDDEGEDAPVEDEVKQRAAEERRRRAEELAAKERKRREDAAKKRNRTAQEGLTEEGKKAQEDQLNGEGTNGEPTETTPAKKTKKRVPKAEELREQRRKAAEEADAKLAAEREASAPTSMSAPLPPPPAFEG